MVDVPAQLQSVTRTYRIEERDGAPAHVQSLEQSMPVPLAEAWTAVTTAERISSWFMPLSGDLHEGGRYQFEGNAGGEILVCEPPADGAAEVAVTWKMMDSVSWVRLRLAAEGESATSIELEHVSRVADEAEAWAGTEEGRSFCRGAADGWAVAHTASGEDAQLAQQRADAPYGFHTGTGDDSVGGAGGESQG